MSSTSCWRVVSRFSRASDFALVRFSDSDVSEEIAFVTAREKIARVISVMINVFLIVLILFLLGFY